MILNDFKALSIFKELARTSSFTKTAQQMKLTQSAVSYVIKNLESSLGCELFKRSTKKVSLTHQGEILLKHVISIEKRIISAEAEIQNIKIREKLKPVLRVGASVATLLYFLERVWSELKERYPDVELELKPGDTSDLIPMLKNGTIDFLIGVDGVKQNASKSYIFHELFIDEKVLIFHPDHSLAKNEHIVKEDLKGQTIITGTRHEPTKKIIDEYLWSLDEPVGNLLEASSLSLQKEMLKMNMGVGIVSPFMYRDELESASLFSAEIPGGSIVRSWGLMVRCDYNVSDYEEQMVKLLISQTKYFREKISTVYQKATP